MRAVIFDMDDTLVATAGVWRGAEEGLLRSLGAAWSEELARKYKGMNALDVAGVIWREVRPERVSLAECRRRMREGLLAGFRRELPGAMPGAVECVRRMAAKGKVAVASGSPREAIEETMKRLGMWEHLAVVVSSEEVKRGKPWPDVFLAAAERLGARAEECLVVEDSLIGVQAAVAAGMRCVAVPSGAVGEEMRRLGAAGGGVAGGGVRGTRNVKRKTQNLKRKTQNAKRESQHAKLETRDRSSVRAAAHGTRLERCLSPARASSRACPAEAACGLSPQGMAPLGK